MQVAAPTTAIPAAGTPVIEFGGSGYFSEFTASVTDTPVGRAAGYGSVDEAIAAVTHLTRGESRPAAALLRDGERIWARELDVSFRYDDKLGGHDGPWRLEQAPHEDIWSGGAPDGDTMVHPSLVGVVDGAHAIARDAFVSPAG